MLKHITLKSNRVSLELGPYENEYINIKFESDGVQAQIKPYLYNDGQELYLYFHRIAETWKGWKVPRTWKSLEGDLQFDATHDSLGYVKLKVSLFKNRGCEDEWTFSGNIRIELGLLDNLAREIHSIFLP